MPSFPIVQEVNVRLDESGLHAALALLNSRTPHRFTGAYRYDGEILRNEGLYDRFSPESVGGDDVPMPLAYCALLGERNCAFSSRMRARTRALRGSPAAPWARTAAPCCVTNPGALSERSAISTRSAVSRIRRSSSNST